MKKAAGIIGIILAVVFVILAFSTQVPDKYIRSWRDNEMREYVGGDAYNYIIEASLRGGEIAGALIGKAIYLGCAAILLVLSLICLGPDPSYPQPIDNKKTIEQLEESLKNNTQTLQRIEKQIAEMIPADDSKEGQQDGRV